MMMWLILLWGVGVGIVVSWAAYAVITSITESQERERKYYESLRSPTAGDNE